MMNRIRNLSQSQESLFGGALLAYLILFFHVILVVGIVILMLFFRTVINYLPWILAIGGVVIVGSWYLWWRRVKKRGKKLGDILQDPIFQGRTVEVTLLGGLASLKLGQSQGLPAIDYSASEAPKQIADPATARAQELTKLGALLKEDLINKDEFLRAKKDLLGQ
jgi:type II secretory pathway component PulF